MWRVTFGVGGESHVVVDGLAPGDEENRDSMIVKALSLEFIIQI